MEKSNWTECYREWGSEQGPLVPVVVSWHLGTWEKRWPLSCERRGTGAK